MYTDDIQKLVEIAKLYYIEHMTQDKISKIFSMSRSAISVCLTEAKKMGIVNIQVLDPSENNQELGKIMEDTFGLRKCIVVPNATYSQEVLTRIVTSQAVRYAVDLMKDHSCIGISWGTACYEFMHSFPKDSNLCDITVVPLIGISPLLTREYQLNESVRMFADKLRGNPIFIYSPGIVQDVSDKQRVLESSYMKPILERWDNMDMAVVGIGTTQGRSELRQYDCEGLSVHEEIMENRDIPVGDVCGRLFNIDGKFVEEEYNSKLIGVDEQMLRKVGNVMAIAAGPSKCVPIIGALRTGLIHYLATDENTVIQLLELMKLL